MGSKETLVIHEIYSSIQGESTFAGLPCTFVRTTGCNLRCVWCDTPQAFHGGTRMERAEVLAKALSFGTPLVEADVSAVDPRVHKIMDLKCPGSGESHRNRWENLKQITRTDEIKFVLADRVDYEWMRATIPERHLTDRTPNLLASTVFGRLAPKDLVRWVLEDALPVRVQLQMHKYVWAPDATGV